MDDKRFFFERNRAGASAIARTAQNKPRLLLIGGTGGDLRRPETRFDSALARNFDVLSLDQRGMGQSFKGAPCDPPFTMADYADDAAKLMDALGWNDAHVLGISFGGMVAQEFVLRHPRKVLRLILCCTAPGGAGGSSFAYHALPAMDADDLAALKVGLSDIRHDPAWGAENPAPYRMLKAFAAADPYASEPGHAQGAARQLAARAGHDCWDRLPVIACPVLVMGGRYDAIAPPAVVTALAQRIPGACLRFFEGGHLFMLEDRTAYTVMAEFLME